MPKQIVLPPGTQLVTLGGRPPKTVLVFILIQLGLFLLWAFTDGPPWFALYLGTSATSFFHEFKLWGFLTAFWIHLRADTLLLNVLSLWIIGSALERWWGSRRFCFFWMTTGYLGILLGLIGGLFQPNKILYGSSGSTVGLMVALAIIFTNHLVFFYGLLPLKALHFAIGIILFSLLRELFSGGYLWLLVELGGGLSAWLLLRHPRKNKPGKKKNPSKPHLIIINGGKTKNPHYWN